MPEHAETAIPRPSEPTADPELLKLVTARLTPNTNRRLVAGCHQQEQGARTSSPTRSTPGSTTSAFLTLPDTPFLGADDPVII
ncbi:hypothetical protein [Nonomuraea aridisoli]|uniref:hypothetical protein n=1 Tax=Nonomuraea aridisoli TaxID=2070368 RepID=UPI0011B93D39|nr:hypothetical protein [Nonomuraea aridisoli]